MYTFPQSVGIAGGRPSSSYYFVGSQADNLFYLDPHNPRPAIPLRPHPDNGENSTSSSHTPNDSMRRGLDPIQLHYCTAYSAAELKTFHCERGRKMPLSGLDPSMLIGFLCRDEKDWWDFKKRVADVCLHFFFSFFVSES